MTEYISKNRVKDYIHATNSVGGFTSYEDYVGLLNAIIDSPAADVINRKAILLDIEENIKKGENEADLLAVQLLKMIKKYIEEFPGIDEQKEESDEHSD